MLSAQDLTVSLDAKGVDPEGGDVTHDFTWYVNGTESRQQTTDTFPAAATRRGDVVSVEVAANDGRIYGNGSKVVFNITNAFPEVANVTITPAAPTSADTVTCMGSATDGDGDPITADYAWLADGVQVAKGNILPPGLVAGGRTLECAIGFSDGFSSSRGASAPVIMGRSAPVVSRVGFRDPAPTAETGVRVSVSGYDPDGDEFAYDYAWTVNGAPAGDGPVIGTSVSAGDLVAVAVTARDADHSSEPVSASVVIGSADIYAPEVSITPDEPAAGDDLVCSIDVEAYDPDGNTLTNVVSWKRDGKIWEGDTFDTDVAGDSVDGADISEGEVWSCSVYAEDGQRTSDADVASAEVGAPREITHVDVMAEDLRGASDTCGAGEAVMDGSLSDSELGTSYMAAAIPVERGATPHAVTFDLDVAVCNADAASDVNFSWGLFIEGEASAIASGTEILAAEGGCSCPDGATTPLTIETVLEEDGVKMEQLEVRFTTDADEMALNPAFSGSYIDITYAW
jgi:hypothetical protein